MTAALSIRGVTKRFGALTAADEVSFDVPHGEIWGFIGPNGAGKTTTMRVCATLDVPDEGEVLVEGRSAIEEPREARRRLGFMPDAYGAYASTTIAEYLDFFARAYGLDGRRRRETIRRVAEFTSLGGLMEKEVTALSKGMRQRLCLAKTLLHDPAVLVLDEPAAGLDPRARVELRELLKALAASGKAILVSSHILSELGEMVDGVAVIERGRIRATGSMDEIARGVAHRAEVFLRALDPPEATERALLEQPRVARVRRERDGFVFDFEGSAEEMADLVRALVSMGLRPVAFAPRETDLEDLFLRITEGKVQ